MQRSLGITPINALKIPRHVAIIMDGNGRWAKSRGLPRLAGHEQGVGAVRRCVTAAAEMGIEYLTIFAFSSENWSRPADEVQGLMRLLKLYFRREIATFAKKGVRVKVIGERQNLAPDIQNLIAKVERETADNTKLHLTVGFNYGARQEITNAVRTIARLAEQGALDPEALTSDQFGGFLETADMPDPDLVIRTSGEQRLSNFLLWQCAYSEFVFVEDYWPDFTAETLLDAVSEYSRRNRRFGGLTQAPQKEQPRAWAHTI
jgi:undecaprenyl diphosphate synthase